MNFAIYVVWWCRSAYRWISRLRKADFLRKFHIMGLNNALTQILVIGCVAFCCPGLFNALSGLGKAGGKNADVGNTANATLYACFAVFGYFGGPFYNLFGNRWLMCVGGMTYAFYAAGAYIAANVDGLGWMAILCGALLGFGAALFWTSQGAMMLSYATAENKGQYIAIFWIIFNLGGLAGGVLSTVLNWNTEEEGQASAASYFTFVGIMTLGAVMALFLLVNPSKVIKADGNAVVVPKSGSAIEEVKGALRVSTNKYMLLLVLYIMATNWNYTYQFNFVNGSLFNIRSRGLNSSIYWGCQMFAAYLMGALLDNIVWTRKKRAMLGFIATTITFGIGWILGFVVAYGFEDGYDKGNLPFPPIDVTESSRCALPVVTLAFYGLGDASSQAFAYWLMGAIAGDDMKLLANFAGFYKGIQSAGSAVAWGIDLHEGVTYSAQLCIAFGLWMAGSLLTFFVVRDVKEVTIKDERDSVVISTIEI